MKYRVFVTLFGRKLQFSTDAENRSYAVKNVLDKIMRSAQIDEIREDGEPDAVNDILGMFRENGIL